MPATSIIQGYGTKPHIQLHGRGLLNS